MEYRESLSAIRRRWWVVFAAAAFALLSAWAATRFLMKNVYESSAMVIVSRPGGEDSGDMLLDPNTIMVYYNLAESDAVAEGILRRLNMGGTLKSMRERIGVEADYDTGILKVSARTGTAQESRDIAGAFIESLREQAGKLSLAAQIRTIDAPKLPAGPASPNAALNLLLGAAGGTLAGLLLALQLGAKERSAEEIPELRRFPRLRVLGALPRKRADRDSYGPVLFGQGDTPRCEAMKLVNAKLQYLLEQGGVKRVMVTSPRPAEGKTTLAVNVAVSTARMQKRVLLVECNTRKPALNHICSLNTCSLLESEGAELERRGYRVASLGIDIVPEFFSSCNQAYSIGSPRVRAALDEISPNYDLIVLDCPSVLPWADALLLGRLADGVVVVADYKKLAHAALEKCLRRLGSIEANILGIVVNNAPVGKAFRKF